MLASMKSVSEVILEGKLRTTNCRIERQKGQHPFGHVDVQWFIDNRKNQCNYCGCGFSLAM